MTRNTILDFTALQAALPAAQAQWERSDPFPWCSFDGMLKLSAAQTIAADFPATVARSGKDTDAQKHLDVNRKVGVPDPNQMSPAQRAYFEAVNTPEFLHYLENLTGIAPIYPDPNLFGGGLHAIYRGGFLNVHADFNFHPETHKWRCLNLITYLNEDWQSDWLGQLELWPEALDADPVLIEPAMNRTALFRTSETSWHGHSRPLECPEGTCRKSVASYYYTDWPEGLEPRAKTTYVLTPWQRQDLTEILLTSWTNIKTEQEAIAAAPRFQRGHVVQVFRHLQSQHTS